MQLLTFSNFMEFWCLFATNTEHSSIGKCLNRDYLYLHVTTVILQLCKVFFAVV